MDGPRLTLNHYRTDGASGDILRLRQGYEQLHAIRPAALAKFPPVVSGRARVQIDARQVLTSFDATETVVVQKPGSAKPEFEVASAVTNRRIAHKSRWSARLVFVASVLKREGHVAMLLDPFAASAAADRLPLLRYDRHAVDRALRRAAIYLLAGLLDRGLATSGESEHNERARAKAKKRKE